MKRNLYILLGILLFALTTFFIGYIWGKSKTETITKEVEVTKYLPGEPIHDTVYKPKPYKEIVHDTVDKPIPTDTAALYAAWLDYNKERFYNLDFSNDTLGEFTFDLSIQRNVLQQVNSRIVPIQKIITNEKTIYTVPMYQFYAMLGSDFTMRANKVEFGLDYKQKYMVSLSGIRYQDNYFYTFNVGLKF